MTEHQSQQANGAAAAQDPLTTVLGTVGRVPKDDVRVEAYGACEEANTAIGYALAVGNYGVDVARTLTSLQNDLFDLVADLGTPVTASDDPDTARLTEAHLFWVDRAVEHYGADLPELHGRPFPGGTLAAALLSHAWTAVRRAERAVVHAINEHSGELNPLTAGYLNSVSSLLFVLARRHNVEHGDLMWRPLASVIPPHAAGDDEPRRA
jgi:cob(I)alamin adenosyltransferase